MAEPFRCCRPEWEKRTSFQLPSSGTDAGASRSIPCGQRSDSGFEIPANLDGVLALDDSAELLDWLGHSRSGDSPEGEEAPVDEVDVDGAMKTNWREILALYPLTP